MSNTDQSKPVTIEQLLETLSYKSCEQGFVLSDPHDVGYCLPEVNETLLAINKIVMDKQIEERQFHWDTINAVRYGNMPVDKARNIALDRLTELQVEQELTAHQYGLGE